MLDRIRRRLTLGYVGIFALIFVLVGLVAAAWIVLQWFDRGFGELSEQRLALLAATLFIVGIQVFFTSFLLSILGLRRRV